MASKLTKVVANFETSLATKLANGATSGALTSITDKNGVNLPTGKYFNITLLDRSNDLIVFQARYCVQQSESWTIPSKGIITGQLQFEAIDWNNEIKSIQS